MHVIEWFIGFHPRHMKTPWGIFGHVEAWGYTIDDAWLFIDPQRTRTRVYVCHRHDDVLDMLEARNILCETILKVSAPRDIFLPLHFPMTCAAQIGHIVGHRAFTPHGLRRTLLRNGAEIVKNDPQRGPTGQSRAPA